MSNRIFTDNTLVIATHNAGPTDVDGHLGRIEEYLRAVAA